jgi:hypothetical protein
LVITARAEVQINIAVQVSADLAGLSMPAVGKNGRRGRAETFGTMVHRRWLRWSREEDGRSAFDERYIRRVKAGVGAEEEHLLL